METLSPSSFTLDLHIDVPWQMLKHGAYSLSINQGSKVDVDFPRMKAGGLNSAFFALYLSDVMQDNMSSEEALTGILQQVDLLKHQEGCQIVSSVEEALSSERVPIFLGLEGGRLIQNSLKQLELFRRLGVRYLTLTHNRNTAWAGSATDSPKGLASFGRDVIKTCEALGVLVDVSHSSDETFWDVMKVSSKPLIASHSGCRALLDHPRNLTDDQIQAIAGTGGVIHIPFAQRFVGAFKANILKHIDHVIQLVGAEHVGVGSDLDGAAMASGIDVSQWSAVTNSVSGLNTLKLLEKN